MIYLKRKLSDDGVSGTGPEGEIGARGGRAEAAGPVDSDGYRIGYLTQTADLSGLETWDVTEVTEAEALAFCQPPWTDAEVMADGRLSWPSTPA